MAADSLDILTSSESKDAIGRSGDTLSAADTDRLETFTTAVSRQLDWLCGPIITRTITSESHDGGKHAIILDRVPVSSVTAVVEYDGTTATALAAESNTSKTADDYLLEATHGIVRRRSDNSDMLFPSGRQNILVTYSAGRYPNVNSVSREFKEAAKIMLRHLFSGEHGTGSDVYGEPVLPAGFAVPNRALELVAEHRRHPNLLVG